MREKVSPRDICEEVGVSHLQWVEVMRRIRDRVMQDDVEVITKTVGTFYRQRRSATSRVLNETRYQIPERQVLALRPARFRGGIGRSTTQSAR